MPCFILGAGCSLAQQDLTPLSKHVTIGVNSGYLAHEAKFYVSDDSAVRHWSYFYSDLKKSKSSIALLYEKKLADTADWFGLRSVVFKHKNGYDLTDTYSHTVKENHIWEARTSVGSAVHIAHIMGCSPIILLGVDCCRVDGQRYFWQLPYWKKKPKRNDGVKIDTYVRTKIRGIESDKDLQSILQYWNMVAAKLNERKTEIFNASPISLVTSFPKVKLKDVV